MSENGNRTATIFYALIMALGGILFLLFGGTLPIITTLLIPNLTSSLSGKNSPLVTVAIFILSIGIALLDEGLVKLGTSSTSVAILKHEKSSRLTQRAPDKCKCHSYFREFRSMVDLALDGVLAKFHICRYHQVLIT